MAASLARLASARQMARLAPPLRSAATATATATPHAVPAAAAVRRWAPAAGTVEAVRAFRSFRRPPLERWYTGRSTGDDDRNREHDERRARRRSSHEAFERGMSALGRLLERGVGAVASGVSHLIDIRSHTERVLLRTGLVKDADAASYVGTTAAVVAWTAVGLTVAGRRQPNGPRAMNEEAYFGRVGGDLGETHRHARHRHQAAARRRGHHGLHRRLCAQGAHLFLLDARPGAHPPVAE